MEEIIIRNESSLSAQQITEDLYSRFTAFIDAKPKTVETYTKALRQLFNYFHEHGINQPQREDIVAFREELLSTGHKPTTVQNYITAAKLFFQWLEQERLYPNVAAHVKGAKIDREHKKDYLTTSQVKAVLAGIDRTTKQGKRDYAIMVLMLTGGLRTIEVVRANVGDMRAAGDALALYVQGKGRDEKTEYIKLSSQVEAAIREYLADREDRSSTAPMFASMSNNSAGARMTTRAISGIVKGYLTKAGYNSDKLTAHSLRHTAVTLSLLAGKPLEEVQQFARHANMQTTMIYNHALEKAKNSCSDAIAAAIF